MTATSMSADTESESPPPDGAEPGVGQSPSPDGAFVARGRLVLALIALMIGIQGLRGLLSPDNDARLILAFAYVPASFARLVEPGAVAAAAAQLVRQDVATADDVVLLLGVGGLRWWTPLTYAFLHGGWTHVLVNSVWLAAFGSAVARRLGATRFLLFFAITAVGGAIAHSLTHFLQFAPLVGASAAISGAMAGAARFAFASGAPLGVAAQRGALSAYQRPLVPLRHLLREPRAMTFLVAWFAANFIFGALATPIGVADASIAWEAHIGGFLTGLLLFRAFDPVQPSRPSPPASQATRPIA